MDIVTRLQGYMTPIGITVVVELHILGGALGNSFEVVDANADANGNGVIYPISDIFNRNIGALRYMLYIDAITCMRKKLVVDIR